MQRKEKRTLDVPTSDASLNKKIKPKGISKPEKASFTFFPYILIGKVGFVLNWRF